MKHRIHLTFVAVLAIALTGTARQHHFRWTGPGSGLVHIAGIPDPRQMMTVREGFPFVVPAGKLLAITALGATRDIAEVALRVDGIDEVSAVVRLPYGNSTTMAQVPPGLIIRAGSVVEAVSPGGQFGCSWGYLVDDVAGLPGLVRVAGIPDPRDMLTIADGVPFVVPANKLLTITAVGCTASQMQATLRVDGIDEVAVTANWSVGSAASIIAVASGLAVTAGSSVSVAGGGGLGRAWGYLTDA